MTRPEPLTIQSVHVACGCVDVLGGPGERIAPGASLSLKVELDRQNMQFGEVTYPLAFVLENGEVIRTTTRYMHSTEREVVPNPIVLGKSDTTKFVEVTLPAGVTLESVTADHGDITADPVSPAAPTRGERAIVTYRLKGRETQLHQTASSQLEFAFSDGTRTAVPLIQAEDAEPQSRHVSLLMGPGSELVRQVQLDVGRRWAVSFVSDDALEVSFAGDHLTVDARDYAKARQQQPDATTERIIVQDEVDSILEISLTFWR